MREKILKGQTVSTKELRVLFECFDLNGDGQISYMEFTTFALASVRTTRRSLATTIWLACAWPAPQARASRSI